MARKPKKGYFVKGQFVAEGSEEDLALKREAKGNEGTSKTDLKRESVELQKLGEDLLGLRSALMLRLTSQGHVDEKLSDALVHARQITNFEGRRRQMQFIQQLRTLVRQARKDHLSDAKSVSLGLAPRQGRAFRELFHLIKSQLTASHA